MTCAKRPIRSPAIKFTRSNPLPPMTSLFNSFQPKRPFDSAEDMLLISFGYGFRILTFEILRRVGVPHIFAMTKRGVKDSPFAVFFGPGNRKIARRFVIRMFVQHEQAMDFAAVEIFDE